MVNKKILYILVALIIIIIIILMLLTNIKRNNISQRFDSDEEEVEVHTKLTKSNSTIEKNFVKKYLFIFWNLCLTENEEGIKALCSNYTKQIPKSINSFTIDQLYKINGLSTCLVKTSLNAERYYYTIITGTGGFTIIEITRDEFEAYKEAYDGKYENYAVDTNPYNSTKIDDDVEASFYINIFINNLKYNVKRAYEELKHDYAIKRYENLSDFMEYVKNNKQTLLNIKVNNSSLYKDEEGNKEYVFYDKYSNVYIIEVDANDNFYIQLDDYTLDNKIFNAVYENSSIMDKALLNCEKFLKMINTKDYKAAYNVLDESFKQTYFKTQQDFENYIKNTVFSYNKAQYEEYRKPVDNLHAFKMILTDATGEGKEQREFNIVMALKENRNFAMSFEVE